MGAKIFSVSRRGKNILIHLSDNRLLLVHQKMTGHLLFGRWALGAGRWAGSTPKLREKTNNYIHFLLKFKGGSMLALSDVRKFSKILFGKSDEISALPDLSGLGPDFLQKISLADFKRIVTSSRRPIKTVLLDQTFFAGLGNIYADEVLWLSRVNPKKPAASLKNTELKSIWENVRPLLIKSIRLGGASMSDYRHPDGARGKYAEVRLVYRQEGEHCPRCRVKIVRQKIGARSAHFCPSCQK